MSRLSSSLFRNTISIILAGGQGERLHPLTKDRSKPSVPFGGKYRIIDFALSNCLNSGFRKIYLLTQYKSHSLTTHIREGWSVFYGELGEFIYVMPPQFRTSNHWYQGTADAVYQNLHILEDQKVDYVIVLGGDHIYSMDYLAMLHAHVQKDADLTIAGIEMPKAEGSRFGVMVVDGDLKIVEFQEKPTDPKPIPDKEDLCYVNMGIYIFKAKVLSEVLVADTRDKDSDHDFGKNIIPKMLDKRKVYAYNFDSMDGDKKPPYWRDIGTIDSYYDASMDLISVTPAFNLYDPSWPLRTHQGQFAPAKTIWDGTTEDGRLGTAIDSLIAGGVIISGGTIKRSIVSPDVRINSYSLVEGSILFNNVNVGRRAKIKRAIIDKNVIVPEGYEIGYNLEEDRKKFKVSAEGIVVVGKNAILE